MNPQVTYVVRERAHFDDRRDGNWVCYVWGNDIYPAANCIHKERAIVESNARRIAECLNACAGMQEPLVQVAAAVVLAKEVPFLRNRVEELQASKSPVAERNFYDRVYDVLVEHAGASEGTRNSFVHNHTPPETCLEWRFIGDLGFGGKYRNGKNVVTCYQEDETPERLAIIVKTNAALAALKQ